MYTRTHTQDTRIHAPTCAHAHTHTYAITRLTTHLTQEKILKPLLGFVLGNKDYPYKM